MKVDKEQKRLKAIKRKYILFPTRCDCCKEEYKMEYMWQFYRYGVNNSRIRVNYCQHCMPSAEDVLHEIDTNHPIPFRLVCR